MRVNSRARKFHACTVQLWTISQTVQKWLKCTKFAIKPEPSATLNSSLSKWGCKFSECRQPYHSYVRTSWLLYKLWSIIDLQLQPLRSDESKKRLLDISKNAAIILLLEANVIGELLPFTWPCMLLIFSRLCLSKQRRWASSTRKVFKEKIFAACICQNLRFQLRKQRQ